MYLAQPHISATESDIMDPLKFPFVIANENFFTLYDLSIKCTLGGSRLGVGDNAEVDLNSVTLHSKTLRQLEYNEQVGFKCDINSLTVSQLGPNGVHAPNGLQTTEPLLTINSIPFICRSSVVPRVSQIHPCGTTTNGEMRWIEGYTL